MKITNYLADIIKKLDGSLIGIGFEDAKLADYIDKNNKIKECHLLDCKTLDDEEGKTIKIRIGKLRKKFKKHKSDYMIYNIKSIKDYKDKFVYDSLYLTNKTIYIYSENNEVDINAIIRRYKRYGKVEIIECSDGKVIKVNQLKKLTKTNELFNKHKDNIISMGDFVSNLLSDS